MKDHNRAVRLVGTHFGFGLDATKFHKYHSEQDKCGLMQEILGVVLQ